MEETKKPKKSRKVLKIILAVIFLIIAGGAYLVYENFNRMLTDALMKGFNANVISDVYELKFDDLNVDVFNGDIKVGDLVLQPRAKPLHDYPYINSYFWLKTKKLKLTHVNIKELLKSGKLELQQILIDKPEVRVELNGEVHILIPMNDTLAKQNQPHPDKKKFISSFVLSKFEFIDASFAVKNTAKNREFSVDGLNITIADLLLDQKRGKDVIKYNKVELLIGEFKGKMRNDGMRQFSLKDFALRLDTVDIQRTKDTLIYHYKELSLSLKKLDIHTKDSLYHLVTGSFDLSYKKKSILLSDVSYKPNFSDAVIQARNKHQKVHFSMKAAAVELVNVNFDSLIFGKKVFIDEVKVKDVEAYVYKDKTKPLDSTNFPKYFGEQLMAVKIPLRVNKVTATNINLTNVERKPDGSMARVKISKCNVTVKNITNLSPDQKLNLTADALIDNKVRFSVRLDFDYNKPQFSLDAHFGKFNLPDLNSLLKAYTPAQIVQGTADDIHLKGMVYKTYASGTMEFLFHDLKVDMALKNQAQWKNNVIAFAANTALASSNPPSAGKPPKIVSYRIDRDMNRGFINPIIKSALAGLKESMFMSKENRKAYKEEKKKNRKGIF